MDVLDRLYRRNVFPEQESHNDAVKLGANQAKAPFRGARHARRTGEDSRRPPQARLLLPGGGRGLGGAGRGSRGTS